MQNTGSYEQVEKTRKLHQIFETLKKTMSFAFTCEQIINSWYTQ